MNLKFEDTSLYAVFPNEDSLNAFCKEFYLGRLLPATTFLMSALAQYATNVGLRAIPIVWFDTVLSHEYDHEWANCPLSSAIPRPMHAYLPGLTRVRGMRRINDQHWVIQTEPQGFEAVARPAGVQRFISEAAVAGGLRNHADEILYVTPTYGVGVVYWDSDKSSTRTNQFVFYKKEEGGGLHPIITHHGINDFLDKPVQEGLEPCLEVLKALGWDGRFMVEDPGLDAIVKPNTHPN